MPDIQWLIYKRPWQDSVKSHTYVNKILGVLYLYSQGLFCVGWIFRSFVKGQGIGRLTSCEDDFAHLI